MLDCGICRTKQYVIGLGTTHLPGKVMSTVLFALAIFSLILIPFAPQLLRVRIRILKWLHWNWAVNLLEKYFDRWVLLVRMILFVIAVVLFYFGWENLGG